MNKHNDEYTLEDILHTDSLTKQVCSRPLLYTANGSIEEVYSFINALTFAKLDVETHVAKAAIAWLINHAELKEAKLNFDSLRKTYGTDANALCTLLRELNESVS